MLKFTKKPQNTGDHFKKTWLFLKETAICKWLSCFSEWNKRWHASIYKEMELKMDYLTSRIPLQKASSYKCQFCTKVCVYLQGWALKFKWWLVNKKYLPTKLLKQHTIPITILNIFLSKGYWRMNYICSQHSNSRTSIFQRKISL